VALVSAFAAVLLAAAVEWPRLRAGTVDWAVALVGLAVLLLPAGLTWLGVSAIREVLSLPGRLRTGAAEAMERARLAAAAAPAASRVGAFYRALRSLRALAGDAASLGTAASLFRISKLPYVILMAVGFALNFVVIALAVLAVLLRVSGAW
jgi:hypothetical protein